MGVGSVMKFLRIASLGCACALVLGLASCAKPETPVSARNLLMGSIGSDAENISLTVVMAAEADIPAANLGLDPVASGIESVGMRVGIETNIDKCDGLTHSSGDMEIEALDQTFGAEMNTWISTAADGSVTHYSYNPGTFEWTKAVDDLDDTDELVGMFSTNPGLFKDLALDETSDPDNYIVTGRLDLANLPGLGIEDLAASVTAIELSPSMQMQATMTYSKADRQLKSMRVCVDPAYSTVSDGTTFTTLSADVTVNSIGDVELALPQELAGK